jgi:hypothetical protein
MDCWEVSMKKIEIEIEIDWSLQLSPIGSDGPVHRFQRFGTDRLRLHRPVYAGM